MDGILVINKEKGWTSQDVTAKLRGILHMKKVGHTGTLDPEAAGVLPVVLGKGTLLSQFLTEKVKSYRAVIRLGITTDTQDMTGKVLREQEAAVTLEEFKAAAASFVGDQMQLPPMYSAVRQGGKRLYELARQGIEVERKERPVTFYEIRVLSLEGCRGVLEVSCSKGTYIRTLCHDIGEKLGCGGCMEELLRTASGPFSLEESYTIAQVEAAARDGQVEKLVLPLEEVLKEYPRILCEKEGDQLLLNGNPLEECFVPEGDKGGMIRLCTSEGRFIGLYRWKEEKGRYYPVKMFL